MNKYPLIIIFLLLIPASMAEPNILDRLTFKEANNNGVCEDGENLLINKDCNLTLEDVTAGNIFGYMWFFRLVVLAAIILYIKKSRLLPLSIILLFGLFVYHGGIRASIPLSKPGVECSAFNLGHCFFPENPFFGWVMVILTVVFITKFVIGKKNSKIYKQSRINHYYK